MQLTDAHPIFDSVVEDQKIADEDVYSLTEVTDWEALREARHASHQAWFDQLDAKHRDTLQEDTEALEKEMELVRTTGRSIPQRPPKARKATKKTAPKPEGNESA